VAVQLAAAYPELVAKLVTVGTSPASYMAPEYPVPVDNAWREGVRNAIEAGDRATAMRLFMARCFSEPGSQKLVETAAQAWVMIPEDTLANFFRPDPGRELRPVLPTLRMPTLVLNGEADLITPVAAARYMRDHIPGALLHVFAGRCHAPNWTTPAEFAEVIRNFVLSR
jgi:pimeloyl-[acyl-carrier protein] methyl ester esterase